MAEFKHGTFNCFEDIGLCVMTYFIPCYTSGKNAEAMGENCLLYGLFTWCGIGFITDAMIRQKIREKYGIEGEFFNDVLCHCCCPCCSLVQEAREIQERGDGAVPNPVAMARE